MIAKLHILAKNIFDTVIHCFTLAEECMSDLHFGLGIWTPNSSERRSPEDQR